MSFIIIFGTLSFPINQVPAEHYIKTTQKSHLILDFRAWLNHHGGRQTFVLWRQKALMTSYFCTGSSRTLGGLRSPKTATADRLDRRRLAIATFPLPLKIQRSRCVISKIPCASADTRTSSHCTVSTALELDVVIEHFRLTQIYRRNFIYRLLLKDIFQPTF